MLIRMQSRVEPQVSARVNPSHPLARGLAGCWLLNEGAGRVVHDVSGYRHDGSVSGGPVWSAGLFGRAIEFDGNDDWISMGDCLDLGTDDITILALLQYSAASQPNEWSGSRIGAIAGKGYLDGESKGYGLLVETDNRVYWQVRNQMNNSSAISDSTLNDGRWHVVIGVCDRDNSSGVRLYVDGVRQGVTADATVLNGIELNGSRAFAIGSRQEETSGAWYWDFLGSIAMVCVWKRVLVEAEIRRLQQDPFGMLASRQAINMLSSAPGMVIQCAGSTQAVASTLAVARAARNVVGVTSASASVEVALSTLGFVSLSATLHGSSTLHGMLFTVAPRPVFNAMLQTSMAWQREALFNGATHAALGLGIALAQGWFWMRRSGCTAVYRGADIMRVDLRKILYVAEPDVQEIPLPAYLSPVAGSTYGYLVRRFNGCGHQEKTVSATAMLSVAADGRLTPAQPNTIMGPVGGQTDATRVRLVWFYCPLDQKIAPSQFNLYRNGPAGEKNLDTPIGTVPYKGRQFYCFHVGDLAAGQHTFIVRAARAGGGEGLPSVGMVRQISTSLPEPAVILTTESF